MSSSENSRKEKLAALEAVVETWWVSTLDAAKALVEIRKSELYKETHATFEQYVAVKWQKTKQWAYDLCNWYEINILAKTQDDPLSMAATRPLKPHRKQPDKVREIVAKARKLANREGRSTPSAMEVETAKRLVLRQTTEEPEFYFAVMVTGTDVGLMRSADLRGIASGATQT